MEVDWDLHAVVRACCSTSSAASPSNAGAGAPSFPVEAYSQQKSTFQDQNSLGFFPDLFQTRSDNSIEHLLNDFNHPLDFQSLRKLPPSPQSLPISPLSVLGGLQDPSHQQAQKQLQGKQPSFGISRCTTSHAQSTRSKKRKNQMKKVCQVPAEGLSTDVWSWRKYGQKPIKGSPYPRGYYRCSTSKGCLARKQVERNRSDPDMFIVTFTGEHNHPVPTHRNSLAGSTRNKPTTSGDEDNTKKKPTSSLPVSPPASVSPATEKPEDNDRDDTDDDNFDLVMDDDFFEGLDELVNPATRDNSPVFIPETSPVAPSFPWLSNNVSTTSTTAAGGS